MKYQIALVVGLLLLLLGLFIFSLNYIPSNSEPVSCTLEAKVCEDGTSVGRTGPNCEFAPCPVINERGVLKGKVIISPICPVEIEGEECEVNPDAYTSRGINIFNKNLMYIKTVNFNADGTYYVDLPVGQYRIELLPNGIDYSQELPKQLTIKQDQELKFNFSIDTGIR